MPNETAAKPLPDGRVDLPGGRVAWPGVVQYRLGDGSIVDLPPNWDSHPDKHAASREGGGKTEPSLPYEPVIHDLDAYERLTAAGDLRNPPHTRPGGMVADNRRTS